MPENRRRYISKSRCPTRPASGRDNKPTMANRSPAATTIASKHAPPRAPSPLLASICSPRFPAPRASSSARGAVDRTGVALDQQPHRVRVHERHVRHRRRHKARHVHHVAGRLEDVPQDVEQGLLDLLGRWRRRRPGAFCRRRPDRLCGGPLPAEHEVAVVLWPAPARSEGGNTTAHLADTKTKENTRIVPLRTWRTSSVPNWVSPSPGGDQTNVPFAATARSAPSAVSSSRYAQSAGAHPAGPAGAPLPVLQIAWCFGSVWYMTMLPCDRGGRLSNTGRHPHVPWTTQRQTSNATGTDVVLVGQLGDPTGAGESRAGFERVPGLESR